MTIDFVLAERDQASANQPHIIVVDARTKGPVHVLTCAKQLVGILLAWESQAGVFGDDFAQRFKSV